MSDTKLASLYCIVIGAAVGAVTLWPLPALAGLLVVAIGWLTRRSAQTARIKRHALLVDVRLAQWNAHQLPSAEPTVVFQPSERVAPGRVGT